MIFTRYGGRKTVLRDAPRRELYNMLALLGFLRCLVAVGLISDDNKKA